MVDQLLRIVPVGSLPQREEVVATLLVLAVAMMMARLTHQLYRGPGRPWAVVCCGPLVTWSLLHWLATTRPTTPATALLFTFFALAAVAELVRSLVDHHHLTPNASLRMLVLTGYSAMVDVNAGVPLLAALSVLAVLRRRPRESIASSKNERRGAQLTMGAMLLVAVVIPLFLVGLHAPPPIEWESWRVAAPMLDPVRRHLSSYLLLPGLAFVALLVAPLRWRGGLELALLLAAGLAVHGPTEPLAPLPTLVAATSAASTGWIWLAGSVLQRRTVLAGALAGAAALVVTGLAALGGGGLDSWLREKPLAQSRPTASLVRFYARGLLAPGDAVLVVDPWLQHRIRDLRDSEDFRPDVRVVAATSLDLAQLSALAMPWAAQGRRILSDSFTVGGRWSETWAVDSGPLYWFIGNAAVDNDQYIDLSQLASEWTDPGNEEGAHRWERMHVERVRFRRARHATAKAVAAFPYLDAEQRRLLAHHQAEFVLTPRAEPASELIPVPPTRLYPHGSITLAEAGDLLWSGGADEAGTAMLVSSAERGFSPAWGALARWQLQAGNDREARETLHLIASAPELRPEAAILVEWLLARGRVPEAASFQAAFVPAKTAVIDELASRLALLQASTKSSLESP